jgi:diketogulonate reductase-like aldo/keto reductase
MELSISGKKKLNNGTEIPYFGLGVYLTQAGDETINAVKWALEAGYRHIDTAKVYGNEKEVGIALKESGIPRSEVFITTKLWNTDHGLESALKAFDNSLQTLGTDYIDLYLIHWPGTQKRGESWKALEKIYKEGRCKAIGVSNYTIRHLKELLDMCEVVPAINQVEFSPFLYQKELLDFCNKNNIQIEAYSPLARAKKLKDARLIEIAKKYSKTPAQLLIRWSLQHNLVVIPKSARKERIIENSGVFDFNISEQDMERLDSMNENFRVAWDPSTLE